MPKVKELILDLWLIGLHFHREQHNFASMPILQSKLTTQPGIAIEIWKLLSISIHFTKTLSAVLLFLENKSFSPECLSPSYFGCDSFPQPTQGNGKQRREGKKKATYMLTKKRALSKERHSHGQQQLAALWLDHTLFL